MQNVIYPVGQVQYLPDGGVFFGRYAVKGLSNNNLSGGGLMTICRKRRPQRSIIRIEEIKVPVICMYPHGLRLPPCHLSGELGNDNTLCKSPFIRLYAFAGTLEQIVFVRRISFKNKTHGGTARQILQKNENPDKYLKILLIYYFI